MLTGNADSAVAPMLEAWLLEVHGSGPYTPSLTVDLTQLEFMTATCIKAFVKLILVILEADQRYPVRFVANAGSAWQRRSLQALACLATDLVHIEA